MAAVINGVVIYLQGDDNNIVIADDFARQGTRASVVMLTSFA